VVDRPLDEPELIDRAKRGDTGAYETLVQTYQQLAFRTAYLITRNEADAEEAAQDGFVKAYRALGRFRSGEPWRPWLLRIVANEAKNRRRSAGRRAQLALRAADESRPGGAVPSPEAALLESERRGELLEAVNGLREEERDVVACRFFLGLSEEETAQTLGLRKGTVKSRQSRALARLREELGEEAADG
jgi:RNA polymerase sigma factor (sigma-70 family)